MCGMPTWAAEIRHSPLAYKSKIPEKVDDEFTLSRLPNVAVYAFVAC